MIDKLTNYQLTQIIDDAEKRIITAKVKAQELKPQVEDYKAAYEKLRDEWHEIECTIIEDQNLLDLATREKNGIKAGAKFRLVRGTSHNDMKEKEKRKLESKRSANKHQFKWTTYAIEELSDHGHWIRIEQLFNKICDKYDVRKICAEKGIAFTKLHYACTKMCWASNDKSTREGKNSGKLLIVGDKIGLKEWADSNFKVIAV